MEYSPIMLLSNGELNFFSVVRLLVLLDVVPCTLLLMIPCSSGDLKADEALDVILDRELADILVLIVDVSVAGCVTRSGVGLDVLTLFMIISSFYKLDINDSIQVVAFSNYEDKSQAHYVINV